MAFPKMSRWVPSVFRRKQAKPIVRKQFAFDTLEAREVPAMHTWIAGGNGFWNDAGNWDANGAPTTGESGGTFVNLPVNDPTMFQNIPGLIIDQLNFTNSGSSTLTLLQPLGITGSFAVNNVNNAAGTTNSINGTKDLQLTGSLTPFFNINGHLTIDTVISGTKDLRLHAGGGVLELKKSNTYTGGTFIDQGILSLNNTASNSTTIPATTLTIGGNGGPLGESVVRLDAGGQIPTATNITIDVDGVLNMSGNSDSIGNLTMKGGQVVTDGAQLDLQGNLIAQGSAEILNLSNPQTGSINLPAGDHTITVNSSQTLTIKSKISGAGNLIKDDVGILAIQNSSTTNKNNYNGLTWVKNGTMTFQDGASDSAFLGDLKIGDSNGTAGTAVVKLLAINEIPNTSTVTIASDGLLDLNSHNETIGALNLGTQSSVTTETAILTLNGNLALAADSGTTAATIIGNLNLGVGDRTMTIADAVTGSDLIINGVITGGNLVLDGLGTLEMQGAGTSSNLFGTTTVKSGELFLNVNGNNKAIPGSLIIGDGNSLNGNATVRLNQNNEVADSSGVVIASDGQFNLNDHSETINGLIIAGGNVTTGVASLFLNAGVVASASATTSTINGNLDISQGTGTFNVNDGAAATDLQINGRILGSATTNVTIDGGGTFEIKNNHNNAAGEPNTYGGKTWIKDGTVILNHNGFNIATSKTIEIGDQTGTPGSAALKFSQGSEIPDDAVVTVHSDGIFNMSGFPEQIGSLILGDSTGGGQVVNSGNSIGLTLNGDITANSSPTPSIIASNFSLPTGNHIVNVIGGAAAVDLQINSIVGGTGTLIKNGIGDLELNGNNTLTGATTVNAGSLFVNGSMPKSAITLTAGILGGSGTVGAITTTSGAVSPGENSKATLSTKDLVLAGSTFVVEIAGAAPGQFDQLDVTGTVNLTNANLNKSLSFVPAAGQQFKIINNDSTDAVVGTFNGLAEGATFTLNGSPFKITYVGGDGNDVVLMENTPTANTPPTITDITNQSSNGVSVGPLSFTVGDAETPPASLTVSATSSNQSLVPNANITLGGSGANRTTTVAPVAGQFGTTTITVTVTDGGSLSTSDTFTLTVNQPAVVNSLLVGSKEFAAGADLGDNRVTLYNPDGTARFTVTPFAGQGGGVRTAVADFNGDGVGDLVVGTGPGGATHVKVIDGVTQAELFTVDPFEAAFTGGVYVAAGDLNGDGKADLAITPDEGGGPRARVFSGNGFTQIADFFGIDDPAFRGGARSAIGDFNGDGKGDLVVAAGFGGGPRVAVFDGSQLSGNGGPKLFGDFFAFETGLRNGIFVSAGDVNGDGFADLVAGGGPGGGPRVFILDGKSLVQNGSDTLVPVGNFFAGDVNNRGGVRVTVHNLDNDGKADVVTGSGTNAGSKVTAYLGTNTTPNGGTPATALDFNAYAGFNGGVFVG